MAEVATRIRVRYRAGLTALNRINHEGALHNVTAIINLRSGGHPLALMCKKSG
ncbi:MAG: hypothetical protein EOP77_00105 [Variovorax sp.]|nr:MAG: hypothetical protein EOP77_00105 [Variovorax sp.]